VTSEVPRFVSLGAVAERYQLSYKTVLAMAKDGRIPAFRVGGRGPWRVNVKQLEQVENDVARQA
jgi:excisionase family DNA binding protein